MYPPNHPEYEPDELLDDIEAVEDELRTARNHYFLYEQRATTGDKQGAEDARDRAQKAMDEIRDRLAAPPQEPAAWADCLGNVRTQKELDALKANGDQRYLTYDRPLVAARSQEAGR